MKFQKETLILFINVTISFYFGFLLWDKIEFKFNDPGIVGIYSENKHNSLNDVARYIIFISLPLISYLLTKIYFGEKFIRKLKIFFLNTSFIEKNRNVSLIIFSVVLLLLILEFFTITFPDHKIDSFHDGQKLSSAYKSYLDGSLWSGSFVTVGIFFETLSTKFIWNIFNHVSIGLMRYVEIILILSTKISLILFVFIFTNFLNLSIFYKNIFFIFNALLFNLLISYTPGINLISYRELPIITISVLFLILIKDNKNLIVLFLISLLSASSLLWGIDRGVVCNLLIIFILIYLTLIGEFRKTLLLLFFISLSWIIFFVIAKDEFFYFFENTLIIFNEMNYIHGLIHPKPFTDDPNSARATKTLLSIFIVTLISLSIILSENRNYTIHLKRSLFFLALVSILSYLYALGRSDGSHIKSSFGYPLIFLSIYLSYNLLLIISERKVKYFNYSLFFIFPVIILLTFQINFKKIITYDERFKKFIKLENKFFLNQKELSLVNELKSKVKTYNCIQLLSNDAALYYLLKKKSCTKYYYVWNSISVNTQKKFIAELENTRLIIEGGSKNNWDFPLKKKLFMVYENVDKDFYLHRSIEDWKVYLRQE